jgi:hypothetical protein
MEAPELERRLAAIFTADVEGYSRLMRSDEDVTNVSPIGENYSTKYLNGTCCTAACLLTPRCAQCAGLFAADLAASV